MQSIIIHTAGIKLYLHLIDQKMASVVGARLLCFFICVAATAIGSEVFYRVVDCPSRMLSHMAFDWIRQ